MDVANNCLNLACTVESVCLAHCYRWQSDPIGLVLYQLTNTTMAYSIGKQRTWIKSDVAVPFALHVTCAFLTPASKAVARATSSARTPTAVTPALMKTVTGLTSSGLQRCQYFLHLGCWMNRPDVRYKEASRCQWIERNLRSIGRRV